MYKKPFFVYFFIPFFTFLIFFGFYFLKKGEKNQGGSIHGNLEKNEKIKSSTCERIISLAPNITEILFALDLGNQVVGVSRFCLHPEAAKKKEKIGGFLDLNFEALLNLKPSVIFALESHTAHKEKLKRFHLNWFLFEIKSVDDILKTIKLIGRYCKVQEKALLLVQKISNRLKDFKKEHKKRKRLPRVLLTLGGLMNYDAGRGVYVAGKGSFYDEIIFLSGGKNVIPQKGIHYPRLSLEGIVNLNPDLIFELLSQSEKKKEIRNKVESLSSKSFLKLLHSLKAYKEDQVHTLKSDYVLIPGPRFILLIEEMAQIINHFDQKNKKR